MAAPGTKIAGALVIGTAIAAMVSVRADAGVGPTGARYEGHLTCATNGYTARVDLRSAQGFLGATIETDSGGWTGFDLGTSIPQSNRDYRAAWSMQSYSPTEVFAVFERQGNGDSVQVTDAADLGECAEYSSLTGAAFTPVTPQRILDTRGASPLGVGTKPGDGGIVELAVAGMGVVPSNASAVAVNITATDTTSGGYVQAFPTNVSQIGAFSTLNVSAAGQTVPNFAIVPLGTGGRVSIYTERSAHLVVDLAGFFVPAPGPTSSGRFIQTSPTRVLDTRAGAKPAPRATVRVPIPAVAGLAPAAMAAVIANVTITDTAGPGFVQVAPTEALTVGASSNINVAHADQTVPNLVAVPVGPDGSISVYIEGGGHVIVDVLGAFTGSAAPPATAGLFVATTPERFLDSRPLSAIGLPRWTGTTSTTADKMAPELDTFINFYGLEFRNVAAVVANLTAVDPDGAGFVQVVPRAGSTITNRGATSNLNVQTAGQTVANAAILATGDEDGIGIYTSTRLQLIGDVSGYFRR